MCTVYGYPLTDSRLAPYARDKATLLSNENSSYVALLDMRWNSWLAETLEQIMLDTI
jgi:hypothetical protein